MKLSAQTPVIDVTDFGAEPDSGKDALPAVQRAIEACRQQGAGKLVFPPGRYDFHPASAQDIDYFASNTTDNNPKHCAMVFREFKGLTVEGNGSEWIFHGKMQPVTVERCQDFTLRGVTIDFKVPFVAEAKILEVSAEAIDIRISPESPFVLENGKLVFTGENWRSGVWSLMELTPDGMVVPTTWDLPLGNNWNGYRAEALSENRVRLHHSFQRLPEVGNTLVLRHSPRDHMAVFLLRSKNVLIEDVTIHTAPGLAFLAQYCDTVTLQQIQVVPNEEHGRLTSAHADGLQVSGCKGQILLENSRFQGQMDDPVNVHGTNVRVEEILDASRLRCRFMHGMSTGMIWGETGDSVSFLDRATLLSRGTGTIKAFTRIDRDQFEVAFENPIPEGLVVQDALENLTWSPDVEIRNCDFGYNRARGLLISTPGRVRILNNEFRSSGSAILIAGDANQWFESGAVADVLIQGNLFHPECLTSPYQFCEGIISIRPEIPEADPRQPIHRNIRIVGNTFHRFHAPVLHAFSVEGLTFSDNTIHHNDDFTPWHHRKELLSFDACRSVTVSGNLWDPALPQNEVITRKMMPEEVGVEDEFLSPTL